MAYTYKKQHVSSTKFHLKCPYSMNAEYITIHNSYNDAPAKNEASYHNSNSNQVSFHIAIDDIEAIEVIPLNRNAWHCGDGNGNGNRKSIGIEICYSKLGGEKYDKSEANAVLLVAKMLHERKWGIDRVRTHMSWSGKYCPHRILDKKNGWQDFLNRVQAELKRLNSGKQKPIEQDDDDKMKFTNDATKQAVREFVKQSVDHKYIDKSWLDKFDKGTMTGGDYDGIQIIVNNKKLIVNKI